MTKKEFNKLALERGVTSTHYQGHTKTMFINAPGEIWSAFKAFIGNYTLPFAVKHKIPWVK